MRDQNFKQFRHYFLLLDQLFEIERKVQNLQVENSLERNINRMKEQFENFPTSNSQGEVGFTYHDPIGESYNETRLDVDASIAGTSTEGLIIVEVIKPIIRLKTGDTTRIIRKGVVIVKAKEKN